MKREVIEQYTLSPEDSFWIYAEKDTPVIYFVTDGRYVKIGSTTDIEKRLAGLQTGNPKKLTIMFAIPWMRNYKYLESRFHRCFEKRRLVGEWFNLKKEDFERIFKEFYYDICAVASSEYDPVNCISMEEKYGGYYPVATELRKSAYAKRPQHWFCDWFDREVLIP